jgi:hypothetical protein
VEEWCIMTKMLVINMMKKTIILIACAMILATTGCVKTSQATSSIIVPTANTNTPTIITTTTKPTTTTAPPTKTTTTPEPTYKFRTNEPPLNPLPVADVYNLNSLTVPLRWLALQQGDLKDGVTLDLTTEMNCVQLSQGIDAVLKSKNSSDHFKEVFLNYTYTLLNSGFAYKCMTASSKSNYQQDIFVFFSADDAKVFMQSFAQASMEMLEATLNVLGVAVQGEIINLDQVDTDKDNWGLHLTAGSGLKKTSMCSICKRDKNILSMITVGSNTLSPVIYSGETIDDVLSLSQKAITKIRSVLGEKDLLIETANNNRFPDLLKIIPATAANMENTYVVMNDFAAVRELNDIAIPPTTNGQDISEYMKALYGMVDQNDLSTGLSDFSFISGYSIWQGGTSINIENVGYNLFNTDAEIYTANAEYRVFSENYTDFYTALIGHFDPAATSKAMNNQTNWPQNARDNYSPETYQNLSIYNWNQGADNIKNAFKPPAFNNRGTIFPFTVTNNYVLNTGTLGEMKAMIAAYSGLDDSLADVKEFELAAQSLAKLNIYTGLIGTEKISSNGQFGKDESGTPLLKLYSVFGTGTGRDLLGPYMALVLVHDNEETAKINYNLLIERINKTNWVRPVDWTDYWRLYVDYAQISIEGNVVLAKLYGDRAQYFWNNWLFENSPLLLHEN